jgi:hypothetical protein
MTTASLSWLGRVEMRPVPNGSSPISLPGLSVGAALHIAADDGRR